MTIREPGYEPSAYITLVGLLEGSDRRLADAVEDVIDLICEDGDGPTARREMLMNKSNRPVYRVRVLGNTDYVVLWWPIADTAFIHYIGPM